MKLNVNHLAGLWCFGSEAAINIAFYYFLSRYLIIWHGFMYNPPELP